MKFGVYAYAEDDYPDVGDEVSISPYVLLKKGVVIGNHVIIGPFSVIAGTIGNHVTIKDHVRIDEGAQVGDHVQIRGTTVICRDMVLEGQNDLGHGVMSLAHPKLSQFNPRTDNPFIPPIIRKGASVGAGVILGPGVEIGVNAIVGMGALVLKDVPEGEVWIGSPARFLRKITVEERVV